MSAPRWLVWLPFPAVAIVATAATGRLFDGLLWASPALLAPALRHVPAPDRRRVLCRDVPAGAALALIAALALAWNAATVLTAPMPWVNALCFAAYVAAWIVALRLLRAAIATLAARCMRRRALASSLATIATVALGLPQLWVALQTHRLAVPMHPRIAAGVAARDVEIATADGVLLRGTFLERQRPVAVVLVCHGVGGNRAACMPYADDAHAAGCCALAIDMRGHGASGGAVSTFGHDEVHDVVAAAAWLRRQPGLAGTPLVLVGVSMGGAAVLRAAAEVGAAGVFTESTFADLPAMIDRELAPLGPLRSVFAAVVACAASLQLGVDVAAVSPRESLRALSSDVSVVLVHAGNDRVIPLAEGRSLAAARSGARLHVIDGATHGGCIAADPECVGRLLATLIAEVAARARRRGG